MADKKDVYYPNGQPLLIHHGDFRQHFINDKVFVYKDNGDPHLPDMEVYEKGRLIQERKRDKAHASRFTISDHIVDNDGSRVQTHAFDVTKTQTVFNDQPAIQLDYVIPNHVIRSYHDVMTGDCLYDSVFIPGHNIYNQTPYKNNLPHGVAKKYCKDALIKKRTFDTGTLVETESYRRFIRTRFIYKPDQLEPDKINEEHFYDRMRAVTIHNKANDFCRTHFMITSKENYSETAPVIGSKRNPLGQTIYLSHCEQNYGTKGQGLHLRIMRNGHDVTSIHDKTDNEKAISITRKRKNLGHGIISLYDPQDNTTQRTLCRVRTTTDNDFDRLLVGYSRLTDKPQNAPTP